MVKNIFSLLIIGTFILLLNTGCNGDYVFQKEIEISGGGWYYNNALAFDFDIDDISKKYNLLLEVEHAGDFGYQNLYVQFHTTYPSGEKKTQIVSLELANKSGIWNGKCGGNICRVEIPLQTNTVFKETGRHSISVEQYMRKDPIEGVLNMAIKIKEVKEG